MKLDTGMSASAPEQAEAFISACAPAANVAQPVNIMSHFSRADEPESDATLKQIACFGAVRARQTGPALGSPRLAARCRGRMPTTSGASRHHFVRRVAAG